VFFGRAWWLLHRVWRLLLGNDVEILEKLKRTSGSTLQSHRAVSENRILPPEIAATEDKSASLVSAGVKEFAIDYHDGSTLGYILDGLHSSSQEGKHIS
jgi:hypothetical protein